MPNCPWHAADATDTPRYTFDGVAEAAESLCPDHFVEYCEEMFGNATS